MQKYLIAAIETALFIAFVLLAVRAWKSRSARHALKLASIDLLHGDPGVGVKAFYVATTEANDPNVRVSSNGLGHRGSATVSVFENGLAILRKGESDLVIQAAEIESIGSATYAVDKGVEREGLIKIRWTNSNLALATFLRVSNQSDRASLLEALQEFGREVRK